MTESGSSAPPFFSAPLQPAEIDRLLALVERRVALRDAVGSDPVPRGVEAGEFATPAPSGPATGGLRALGGLLFDAGRGGGVARAAKRVANLVLRPFGRPQRYFHDAVAATIDSTMAVLRTLEHDARRMGTCLAQLDEQLGAFERRMVTIEHRRAARPDGPRVRLGDDPGTADRCLCVDSVRRPGVHLVADLRRLPFARASLAEIAAFGGGDGAPAPHDLAEQASSHWLALLRPGGRLRIACPDPDRAALLLNRIIRTRAESGESSRLTFRTYEATGGSMVEVLVHGAS